VLVTATEQPCLLAVLRSLAEVCRRLLQTAGAHADVIQTGQQVAAQAELVVIAITLQSNARQVWAWADLELLE
jgi:hypothetical protein